MLKEAVLELEGEDIQLHIDKRDESLCKKLLSDLHLNCEIVTDLTSAGGLNAGTKDQKFIIFNTIESRFEKAKELGAPLEWVPIQPVVFHGIVAMLASHAPHPNAAKVFINWLLSKEGQTLQSRASGKQSARVDVPTDFLDPETCRKPDVKYLELLQRAELGVLDIIAFTDHNTVAGYRKMQDEINQLELLASLNRIMPEEQNKLREYHRLLEKILVLPGLNLLPRLAFIS
jgi:hypothetical protein